LPGVRGHGARAGKPQLQLTPPEKLFEFPKLDALRTTRTLELKGFNPAPSGVCSVPLLEVHVEMVDPGMVFTPGNTAVAMPQAHVPAPACQKK